MALTIERLKALLWYDPETGIFTFRIGTKGYAAGSVAGVICKSSHTKGGGYRKICINRRDYLAHRLAWFYHYGRWPSRLDHRDTDRDNNRIANLREANTSQNGANRTKQCNNTSGFKGVTYHTKAGKWMAQISANGSPNYLGLFDTREAAHAAYRSAAARLHQEFARVA